MLEEHEWAEIEPLILADIHEQKRLRGEGISLEEVQSAGEQRACKRFEAITGFRETSVYTMWHHRRSDYGQDCPRCARPFRSPQANFCAECGYGQKDKTA